MEYNYPIGLTSQFYFCGMPFRLDSYRGCLSGCKYCYVHSRNGNYNHITQYANPDYIKRIFNTALTQRVKPHNIIIELIQRKMPIHFGGISDPLLIPSSQKQITLEILNILDRYEYPTLISTKSDLSSDDDFAKIIIGRPHFAVQVSFSTFDDKIALIIEPNSPLPSSRLKGVKLALNEGNWVSCRLQPFFPGQDINNIIDIVSHYKFKHILMEHFKLPIDNKIDIDSLNLAYNTNIIKLFPKYDRIRRGREFEMSNDIRLEGIILFIKNALRRQISLGIGDNGFQHLSTSPCCCGIDSLKGFENWNKYNVTMAVRRAMPGGMIKHESIAGEWVPKQNISRMINSRVRLINRVNNVKNHIKSQWDHNKQFSPSMFFNVETLKSGSNHYYYLNNATLSVKKDG